MSRGCGWVEVWSWRVLLFGLLDDLEYRKVYAAICPVFAKVGQMAEIIVLGVLKDEEGALGH